MTAKHLLEGVMQTTSARNHNHVSQLLGLDPATVHRMDNGKATGMQITTLDQIQQKTGLPIQTLWGWYRLPEGAVLGRISTVPAQAGMATAVPT